MATSVNKYRAKSGSLTFQQTLYNGVDVQLVGFCHAILLFSGWVLTTPTSQRRSNDVMAAELVTVSC